MADAKDFQDRMLSLGLARVSEAAALASARLVGRGDEKAADQAAVNAMRDQLNLLDIAGVVVIGEGERDEAPMLFIGEEVGTGKGPAVDIALDPLEGTTLTAKDMPNALTVIAMAPRGTLLHAPDVYMDKLAIGPGYAVDTVTLDMSAAERVRALARAKGCTAEDITVCILERPRHEAMIEEVRSTGAAIRLITDGDVAGVIHCAEAEVTESLKPPPPHKAKLSYDLDWGGMIRTARRLYPTAEVRILSLPREGNGLVSLRLRQQKEWLPNGRTTLWFAADTGQLMHSRDALKLAPRAQAYNALYPLHAAKVGGLPYRLVMTLSGLTLGLFGTLTVWTFWFARKPRRRREPRPA